VAISCWLRPFFREHCDIAIHPSFSTSRKGFERIGLPSLLLQVITGLLLAYRWLPEISAWLKLDSNLSIYVATKLALLAATLSLALNAKFRVIPNINRDNMHVLASHIILVTVMAIGFLLAGVAIRTGGLF
jgi:hypothetical protein